MIVTSDNGKYFITWYEWLSDDRLLISFRFAASRFTVESVETRLMAVNRDGSQANESLVPPTSRRSIFGGEHYSQFQDQVIAFVRNDPRHVLLSLDRHFPNTPNVYRLDVYTGSRELVQANPGTPEGLHSVSRWIADRQGRVRVGIGGRQNLVRIIVRPADSDEWQELIEYDRNERTGPCTTRLR